jgi:hypothetical protein
VQTREQREGAQPVSPSTADSEPAPPEKAEGPARPTIARAAAADTPAERVGGAAGQAQLARAMQHSVGNAGVGRLASGGGARVQRQAAAKTPLVEVQGVRSLHIEQNLERAKTGGEGMLARRLKQRRAAIEKELAAVSKLTDQPWAQAKAHALTADLKKDLPAILKAEDSKYVDPRLRADVVAADKALEKQRAALKAGEQRWHAYDADFADNEVAKILAPKGFTPAELKALVAQESGDLTKDDRKGDIAGIAQMGAREAKEAGGKPEDRLDPHKAIPLAAKVLITKANQLEAGLNPLPGGVDYKLFVFASYNAGARTIVEAQRKAKAMKRDPSSWASLVQGDTSSPLFQAIKVALPDLSPARKYREVTDYVERIQARLK